jgi:hypothetical protein
MNKVCQIGKKYFELSDGDNNQYRIFLRKSKHKTESFSIFIIQEISPTKSISYKRTFILDEFNKCVSNYKKYPNVALIQNDIMASIMNGSIQIKQIDDSSKSINILLNNTFPFSFKILKNHEIFESNEIIKRTKEQMIQTNNLEEQFGALTNDLDKCEEENKSNDIRIQKLKDISNKLYNLFNNRKKQMNEDMMLSLTKEERYRILGIKSDIVHTIDELLYISRWLSSEKVTKLDLLFKGPFYNFEAIQYHSRYDNIVPCLILIETVEGGRFGGFTNQTWKGENEYKKDNTAFLFSLDFLEKYPIDPNCCRQAILAKTQYFFAFGKGDLIIYDHCNKYFCKSEFPVSYKCLNNNVNPKFRLTRYKEQFIVKDIEVFLVSFHLKSFK